MTKSITKTIEFIRLQEKKNKRSEKPVEDSSLKKSRIRRPLDFKSRKLWVEDRLQWRRTDQNNLNLPEEVENMGFRSLDEIWKFGWKWKNAEERDKITPLSPFYILELRGSDARRITWCVAHLSMACRLVHFQPSIWLDAWRINGCVAHPVITAPRTVLSKRYHLMRGASLDAWRIFNNCFSENCKYLMRGASLDAWRISPASSILGASLEAWRIQSYLCSFCSFSNVVSGFQVCSFGWSLHSSRSSAFHVFPYIFWAF